MAYYVNGTLISGANTLPKMTMAEYLALPASERPTYWECTDKDYVDISAENVSYGSGSVKDALDKISIETTIVQGTTPSAINTFAVIANFPTGWNANNTYVVGFDINNSNNRWYTNATEVNVIASEGDGIRVKVTLSTYVSRPIKVMLARVV